MLSISPSYSTNDTGQGDAICTFFLSFDIPISESAPSGSLSSAGRLLKEVYLFIDTACTGINSYDAKVFCFYNSNILNNACNIDDFPAPVLPIKATFVPG
jgi:hypothetical protein